jgi:hypothetical protein
MKGRTSEFRIGIQEVILRVLLPTFTGLAIETFSTIFNPA